MLRLFPQNRFTQRQARLIGALLFTGVTTARTLAAETPIPSDPKLYLERTCFQTSQPWSEHGNLGSDVAIDYGIGPGLPVRMQTWRAQACEKCAIEFVL